MYCRNYSYSLNHHETRGSVINITPLDWKEHTHNDYNTCGKLNKGGGPVKKSRYGSPKFQTNPLPNPNIIDSTEILKLRNGFTCCKTKDEAMHST